MNEMKCSFDPKGPPCFGVPVYFLFHEKFGFWQKKEKKRKKEMAKFGKISLVVRQTK